MSKRFQLIIASILVVVVISGIAIAQEYLSWKNISFVLSSNTTSIKVYSQDKEVASATGTSTIRLKPGTYRVIPSGNNIVTDAISVEVKNDTSSIQIAPYYTADYLSTAFTGEYTSIVDVLHTQYPVTTTNYIIAPGRFYHTGDWYGTVVFFSSPSDTHGIHDAYAVVLHKVDGKWVVAAPPKIVISYKDYPDIPQDVINGVNHYAIL